MQPPVVPAQQAQPMHAARPMAGPAFATTGAAMQPGRDMNQFLRQQQQMASQARARQQAATDMRRATEAVFAGLVGDCVSFAEHVLGSRVPSEVAERPYFSEADLTHVVEYVVKVYELEVEAERAAGRRNAAAEEKHAKIMVVKKAAEEVMRTTRILMHVRLCLSETASEALRNASTNAVLRDWQEVLATSPRYVTAVEYLMRFQDVPAGLLTRQERNLMLHTMVVATNKNLERTLEKMVDVDALIGPVRGATSAISEEEAEMIRRECFLIGCICCKHVVGILGQGAKQQS
jgi:hypothetical protein